MAALALGIAHTIETRRMRIEVSNLGLSAGLGRSGDTLVTAEEAETNFAQVLRTHRERFERRKVQFLPCLCFPMPRTRDAIGTRFVLWYPMVRLLVQVFAVQVEDWMCDGEVALVYLKHEVGRMARRIYPHLEKARLSNPYYSTDSALQLTANTLLDVVDVIQEADPDTASGIEEMRRRFVQFIRSPHYSAAVESPGANQSRSAAGFMIAPAAHLSIESQSDILSASPDVSSESSLAQDWLRLEEDQAWNYLETDPVSR